MTAVELVNLALAKIGQLQGIVAVTDVTPEAYLAGIQYDHHLRETLRSYDWPFATAYATLTLTEGEVWDDDWTDYVQAWSASNTYRVGAVVQRSSLLYYCLVEHSNQQPPNATYWAPGADSATEPPEYVAGGDWQYAYRWPTDCLKARRLVDDSTGRKFNRSPLPWRIYRDANGLLIATDRQDAVLEYTLLDCDNLWADDIFLDAFTWRLAAALAPGLSRNGLTAVQCLELFVRQLHRAMTVHMTEQQQEPGGQAEWIEGR
jgi:hypothetical protein